VEALQDTQAVLQLDVSGLLLPLGWLIFHNMAYQMTAMVYLPALWQCDNTSTPNGVE
jgi:hypothetical protein